MSHMNGTNAGMNKEQIYGRRVWSLLHSMGAYYPNEPTEVEKQGAKDFFVGFMQDGIEYPEWGQKVLHRTNNGESMDV